MLNHIIVGSVLIVDVTINAVLENKAKTNSHQTWTPKRSPGNIIAIFVPKDKASIALTLLQ
jgi:hypothetical protein